MLHIHDLPYDVLVKVFSFLNIKELLVVQGVSNVLEEVSNDISLWKDKKFIIDAIVTDKQVLAVLSKPCKLQNLAICRPVGRNIDLCELITRNCHFLTHLEIYTSINICKSFERMLKSLTNLECLHLPVKCAAFNEICSLIAQLNKLKFLKLIPLSRWVQFVSLNIIADGCPLLEYLDLIGVGFNDSELEYLLNKKPRLKMLGVDIKLKDSNIRISLLKIISENLQLLSLYFCSGIHLSDEDIKSLQHLSNLQKLYIFAASDFEVFSIHEIFKGKSNLEELKIRCYDYMPGDFLNYISASCPGIQKLDLSFHFVDSTLDHLPDMYELKCFKMYGYDTLTVNRIHPVFLCKSLEKLTITGIADSEHVINEIIQLKNLKKLKLVRCNATNFPFSLMVRELKQFKKLVLVDCDCVDHDYFEELEKNNPHLWIRMAERYRHH